jgi:hypothetical protein
LAPLAYLSCLQTITDREIYRPEDAIGSMCFDSQQDRLLTGNTCLKAWPLKVVEGSGATGHARGVVQVLHNVVLGDALSGDLAGTVCVWDTCTGKLRFR